MSKFFYYKTMFSLCFRTLNQVLFFLPKERFFLVEPEILKMVFRQPKIPLFIRKLKAEFSGNVTGQISN